MRLATILALLPLPALAQVEQGPPNAPYQPAWENQTRAPELPATAVQATPFAGSLEHPWGIARLPDGSFLVTERPGRMRLVSPDGTLSDPIAGLPEVDAREQGGLLDVAVSPGFAQDRTVFWTYAKPMGQGLVATAAARGTLSEDGTRLTDVKDIFVQQPPSADPMHYGSRVVPDGQGHVFVTTGEHYDPEERWRAQDLSTTWGKVVRVNVDGTVPGDNPFVQGGGRPEVWTLGHRNVQGAAIDGQGRLWTIEHGPMGGDELNLSVPGTNYGWAEVSYGLNYDGTPVGTGQPRAEGFAEPNYYWDPVIAPGGMDFYGGTLFGDWRGDLLIGSLNPGGLVRIRLDGERVAGEKRMLPDLGRVRDVEELPDGSLLLLTDFEDGGIVRVTPG
ncbi:PQQ-dependent oxidoreductase, gdhB family [Rubellimicrobium mesophilum DSM 19309]|uniref:PQQ-dependent oxidoreductase, gdhB family n=1 Tax=Rubellimicrobium mesophilum DSM 19309 TaxID=442562 RepID=A0A017HJY0_9RHOB|nr:PQQ-dependent sugar dehydrogenase [Rubellimicrobium mesophilum]EYD74661.1 PQQ-dependent oxidoreductase, gdhB family [Rubellimicrobium mesophilum DSM 19309]